ncbi:MAG: hypothetical protein HN348_34070, partial [Proteobacteria bacterium]|nr:hypothetical protein [Pseudomonadota bacterium]
EFWSDDVIWNYQVIEADFQPDANDELHHFAMKHDGSIAELAVIRAHLDPQLNDDVAMLAADPIIYLVFRQKRNRLAGIVSFVNIAGERVERAYSSKELGRSWSTLSQSNLVEAPSYLAPFGFKSATDEMVLENGSYLVSDATDSGAVDVTFRDELGGGLVATRYHDGAAWPDWTVSANLDARLMTDEDIRSLRQSRPWLAAEPPDDFDYRRALATAVDIDEVMMVDLGNVGDTWSAAVRQEYEPWNGYFWPESMGALVFGYDRYRQTYSELVRLEIDHLKIDLVDLAAQLRELEEGEERDEVLAKYTKKRTKLVDALIDFYDGIRDDLDGGQIKVADGTMTHRIDGWSYDLDELSPLDKFALHTYLLDSVYMSNPFYLPGIRHHPLMTAFSRPSNTHLPQLQMEL